MEVASSAARKRGGKIIQYKSNRKSLWQCKEGHQFWLTLHKVHRRGQWCKKCGHSIGERIIRDVFNYYQIFFQPQVSLPGLPRRTYDYYFESNGHRYLLEYDGQQHFHYVRKYHRKPGAFKEGQLIDRVKTYWAVQLGFQVIRIDYTQRDWIAAHLINAVNLNWPVYYSAPQLYQYITGISLTYNQVEKYTVKV
jgi:hypothetical protein